MASPSPRTRLFVEGPLEAGGRAALTPEAAHHALSVLRLKAGDTVLVFNGRDGEWEGRLEASGRRRADVVLARPTREQETAPDVWLLFAPLKKTATDFAVEKAVEMGAARILPVLTRRTETKRVNVERLQATARGAAEQCERLDVPEVAEAATLEAVLAAWDAKRTLFVAAERRDAPPLSRAAAARSLPHAILIGPEGGFEREELDAILKLPFAVAVTLGPRVLRAETAAVAALALWQDAAGQNERQEKP